MKRFVLAAVLSSTLLGMGVTPACACLWDRELEGHEKEFKSNYLGQTEEFASGWSWMSQVGVWAGGAGVLMLISGVVVGVVRGKARQRTRRSQSPFDEDQL